MAFGRAEHEDGVAELQMVQRVDIANSMRMLVHHFLHTDVARPRQHAMSKRIVGRTAGADEMHAQP